MNFNSQSHILSVYQDFWDNFKILPILKFHKKNIFLFFFKTFFQCFFRFSVKKSGKQTNYLSQILIDFKMFENIQKQVRFYGKNWIRKKKNYVIRIFLKISDVFMDFKKFSMKNVMKKQQKSSKISWSHNFFSFLSNFYRKIVPVFLYFQRFWNLLKFVRDSLSVYLIFLLKNEKNIEKTFWKKKRKLFFLWNFKIGKILKLSQKSW